MKELDEAILRMCGGDVTSAYFKLQNTEISEVLYILERFNSVQEQIHKSKDSSQWGGQLEFEE